MKDTGSEGTQSVLEVRHLLPVLIYKAKDMDAQEILSQLIFGKITVSQALQLTRLYYSDLISDKSLKWIENECDGYKNSLHLPDYRLLDCSLAVEVYDGCGNKQEYPLDTSHIVSYLEAGGYGIATPNKMRITQNLESLEHGDGGCVDSDTINMYLNDTLRDMILKCYSFPPITRFGRIIQESHSAYVQILISKVKSKLIDILQNEVLKNRVSLTKEVGRSVSEKKKIFISYSWDSEAHKLWVHKLAE